MSDDDPPHRFDISTRWARRAAASGLPEWLGHLAFVVALLTVLVLLWFLAALFLKLAFGLWSADASNYQVQRNIGAVLFALLGFGFAGWRTYTADRQSRAAAAQAKTALETNITSRINEAVRMLGAAQTVKVRRRSVEWEALDPEGNPVEGTRRHAWEYEGEPPPLPPWYRPVDPEKREATDFEDAEETRPHIEVRLGALYALERIAQDSERDHIPIMETLCAYIRENAPARDAPSLGLPELKPLPEDADETQREARARRLDPKDPAARRRARALPPPRADLQTALTVIGRRDARRRRHEAQQQPPYRLDLRNTNLQRADLARACLKRAVLDEAAMQAANLVGTAMDRASFCGAKLEGTNLFLAGLVVSREVVYLACGLTGFGTAELVSRSARQGG
ncbi:MAG: pentapeptide repeat-containing protein [Pseudomonadota bacterium]